MYRPNQNNVPDSADLSRRKSDEIDQLIDTKLRSALNKTSL